MVVDYEASWHELQALIAGKSQHGREPTLIAMAEIAQRHRVAAGEKSRLLRLYGIEVERVRAAEMEPDPDEPESFGGGSASPSDGGLPGHHRGDGGVNGEALHALR